MTGASTSNDPVRERLVTALREARLDSEEASRIFSQPYSTHNQYVDHLTLRGVVTGCARALEAYDAAVAEEEAAS